jgi:hypothetical protein
MSTPISDFSHLSPAERIELAEQLAELRRRWAALEADGDPGEPWEAVLDRIESEDR